MLLNEEFFNYDEIPYESGIEDNELYEGFPPYSHYRYFGDCRNTVDVDCMWDATEMLNFIQSCQLVPTKYILTNETENKLTDGDRKIPKKFLNIIKKLNAEGKIDDVSEIVCGIDNYQKIMFIYLSETDIHYFFDCEK